MTKAAPSPVTATPLRREPWTRLPVLLLVLTVVAYLYLGARPGGRGPIWVFGAGRAWLGATAALALVSAAAWSALRRPFLQPGRGAALGLLALTLGLSQWPLPYPSSRSDRPSSVAFRLPVEGEWRVVHGGEGREANLFSILSHDRRYALALVREEGGVTRRADADPATFRPGDFLAYGEPVLAPADGRVVAVRDGLPDAALPLGDPDGPALGNRVVLEVAEGEYAFVSHLQPGSILVHEGDRITAGTPVGRVGFSGRSPLTREPHVEVHLQTTPEDGWGEGVPWSFRGYEADGRAVERGLPRGGIRDGRPAGERVRALPR